MTLRFWWPSRMNGAFDLNPINEQLGTREVLATLEPKIL